MIQHKDFAARQALHQDGALLIDCKGLPGFQQMVLGVALLGQPNDAIRADHTGGRLLEFKLEQFQAFKIDFRANLRDNNLSIHFTAINFVPASIHLLSPIVSGVWAAGLDLIISIDQSNDAHSIPEKSEYFYPFLAFKFDLLQHSLF